MISAQIRSSLFTRPRSRMGLTIIEIMIALTMTLIILGAMMTAFQFASEQMQNGRAVMEMANRLRSAEELLRNDMKNLTVDPRPFTESTNPPGYVEFVEGPRRDLNFPLTAVDTNGDGILDGILDSDGDSIPDPIDVDVTGGLDADGDGIDDRFDTSQAGNSYQGDHDDVWAGTVRSEDQPFRGRFIATNATFNVGAVALNTVDPSLIPPTAVIESPLAEVVWWTSLQDDSDFIDEFSVDSVRIHRRVLLIRPGLALPAFQTFAGAASYLATNDISARVVTVTLPGPTYYQVVANSLKDLANRANRFCHQADINVFNSDLTVAAPRRILSRAALWNLRSADYTGTGFNVNYNGNDILLTDVAAFDVKVYSPNVNVGLAGGVTVEPHDVGYVNIPAASRAELGGYVDLGHTGGGWFNGYATPLSQLTYQYRNENMTAPGLTVFQIGLMETVYDTWTPLYESDGLNQDGDVSGGTAIIDEGTNGIDNGGPAAPDDDSERETRPPYPFPVRGVKVTIRLVEKTTKQIHQSSVIQSYVPE